jgi:hypothetical protein
MILEYEPLLITLDYQQRHICTGPETTVDDSYEPLQMTFYIVVSEKVTAHARQ